MNLNDFQVSNLFRIFTYNLKTKDMTKKLKGTIYLSVMDFNSVTVNLYQISEEIQKSISEEIDETDDDYIVQEFMSNQGHSESECNYMFSRTQIEVFIEGEKINILDSL